MVQPFASNRHWALHNWFLYGKGRFESYMVSVYPQFYDSTAIEALEIPGSSFNQRTLPTVTRFEGVDRVCLYMDGSYSYEANDQDDFPHVRLITIYGDHNAGILDYEPGNPLYEDFSSVRNYLISRAKLDRRGRIYCDRNDFATLYPRIIDLPHEWWIATLDNLERTPQELINEIEQDYGIRLPEDHLWGHQWQPAQPGGPYRDRSSLFRYW